MGLINRNTDYAVRALCFIAQQRKRVVSVSELVESLGVPRPFLRKILQRLNKKKLLVSSKGQGGGFKLIVSADKIFLTDLLMIFQKSLKINECLFKGRPCPHQKSCLLKNKIDLIEQRVIAELKSINIKNLI